MSRGPSTFRQRDVAAAIKAARDAGVEVARVEVDKDGKIIIVIAEKAGNGGVGIATSSGSEWDNKYGASKSQVYK
jgi:hypothetical protein